MNVDGEFFKLKNPDIVLVQLAKECVNDGKLKILTRGKKRKRI